jgi:fatty-acid desaturase
MTQAPTSSTSPLPRLQVPESVNLKLVRWFYVVPTVLVHALALAACLPWLFSWWGLAALVVGVPVLGQGINLCYHRLLTHRSFATPRWFEHALVVFTLCSLEDTPIRWVTTHRVHHLHSDERPDPHSPLVTFLWGHMGWLMFKNPQVQSLDAYNKYSSDLVRDRFYRKLESKPWIGLAIYLAHLLLLGLVGAAIGYAMTGTAIEALRVGLSVLVWGGLLRTVVVWHVTWSVNSLSHFFGYRSFETSDDSRNNWLVGLIASGEGWHNNHHHDPTAASLWLRWWEIDLTYSVIVVLSWLGLAKEIVPAREVRVARAAQKKAELSGQAG